MAAEQAGWNNIVPSISESKKHHRHNFQYQRETFHSKERQEVNHKTNPNRYSKKFCE